MNAFETVEKGRIYLKLFSVSLLVYQVRNPDVAKLFKLGDSLSSSMLNTENVDSKCFYVT